MNKAFKDKQRLSFKRRTRLKAQPTLAELIFRKRLEDAGVRHVFQKGFIKGTGFYIVDFYLPRPLKIAIEIDGEYHSAPKQVAYDKRKDAYFSNRGISVIRIKNEDVGRFDISLIANRKQ